MELGKSSQKEHKRNVTPPSATLIRQMVVTLNAKKLLGDRAEEMCSFFEVEANPSGPTSMTLQDPPVLPLVTEAKINVPSAPVTEAIVGLEDSKISEADSTTEGLELMQTQS